MFPKWLHVSVVQINGSGWDVYLISVSPSDWRQD